MVTPVKPEKVKPEGGEDPEASEEKAPVEEEEEEEDKKKWAPQF